MLNKKNIPERLKLISKISAIILGTIGVLVITGWLFGIPFLKNIFPSCISMKFNTSLSFVFSGMVLWLLNKDKPSLPQKIILFSCLFFILLMSSLNLYEYFFEKNIGIDELFMKDDLLPVDTLYPGRMAPITACNFLLVVAAFFILFFKVKNYKIAHSISLFLFATSLFSIFGYLYDVQVFYNALFNTKMAVHTSFAFFILSIGLLTAQGDTGIISFFTSNTIGGTIVRRLIPLVIFLMLTLGWLQLQGEKYGWYKSSFGVAFFNVIDICILVIIILWSVKHILLKEEKRKEAEQLLIEANEYLENLFRYANAPIIVWDSSFKINKFNPAFEILTGLSAKDVIGTSIEILFPKNKLEESMKLLQSAQLGKRWETVEIEILRTDNTIRTVLWNSASILDVEGKNSIATIAQGNDITDRKLAEGEIRLNETRLKSLVEIFQQESETIPEFLDHALTETIRVTNSKIGYIYYYSEEKQEFTLNTWSKDVMKACKIVEKLTVYQLGKTGIWGEAVRQRKPIILNNFQATHPLKKGYPDGHSHLHNFLTVPVFSNNKIVGVVAVANKPTDYNETDILQLTLLMNASWKMVDRKRAEITLRESEERYRSVAESANDAIISTDTKGIIIDWNPGAEKIFGYTGEETIGKDLNMIIPPCYREAHNNGMKRLALGKGQNVVGRTVELQGLHKSGKQFAMELSLAEWENGSGKYFTGIIRDITERKQAEEKRKQNEQTLKENALVLTSKNIQLTDFCNIVSHNLRGPLINISMLIDFIENSKEEEERKEIFLKFKPVIKNLNEHFNELIQSLQVRNDHEIKSEKVNIKECIQKILVGMETEINMYQASIEINVSDSPVVNFPTKYLNSILFNLVNNSLKYKSPERPPIIKIKTEKIKDTILLSVADNGLGIDLKMHKESLFKISKVFHEHPEAKGFGLFMTKTHVEAMGGKIWAESTPGEGSTFFIELKNQTI